MLLMSNAIIITYSYVTFRELLGMHAKKEHVKLKFSMALEVICENHSSFNHACESIGEIEQLRLQATSM